jgi:hypothetical protein
MKSDVDRDALQKVLGDLETRLKAYLVEWQRQLGIQEQPDLATSVRNSLRQPPNGRRKA